MVKCDVLPGIDIDNIPKQFEIIEDLDLLPIEVNNKDFKFGKINMETDKIEEDYVFFHHRLLIQCVNPKSYNLRDGLLVVTDIIREKDYDEGYLFFRYYQGKFYLIEHFKTPFGSPTLNRDLYNWINEHTTTALNNFYKEFYAKYSNGKNVDND